MSDLFDLPGKTAVVTGGSRGLGLEIALGLARAGADIVVVSRDARSCQAAAERIESETGRTAVAHPAHVGHWDELDTMVDAAYDRFGNVDILVNNAGMSPLYPSLVDVTEELLDKVLAVNLKAPFRLSATIGTRMAAGNGGSIINISSMGAVRPRPHLLPTRRRRPGSTP